MKNRLSFKLQLQPILVFGSAYVFYLLLNLHQLRTWHLSGDDLYSLSGRILSLNSFLSAFTNFSGQYRPLTYLLFNLYHLLMPRVMLIWLLHGLWLSLIASLLFYLLLPTRSLSFKERSAYFVLSLSVLLSPIFYYHAYTISSLANLLIAVIFLIELLYFKFFDQFQSFWHHGLFFTLALSTLFIKETFFIPLAVFLLAWFLLKKARKSRLLFLVGGALIFVVYFLLRVNLYQVTDSNYSYVFSFSKFKENSLSLFAWFINYPRGWAYGAPNRFMPWQALISLSQLGVFVTASSLAFLKFRQKLLIYLFLLLLSLSPYLFLNRILVYYLDIAFLLLLLILGLALDSLFLQRKILWGWGMIGLWMLLLVSNLWFIKPQWLRHSFVARANQAVDSYLKQVSDPNLNSVCILNHRRGAWGTENGLAVVHYYPQRKIQVISLKEKQPTKACLNSDLVLFNDAWSYKRRLGT